jgi:hypothetical protein
MNYKEDSETLADKTEAADYSELPVSACCRKCEGAHPY